MGLFFLNSVLCVFLLSMMIWLCDLKFIVLK